MTNHEDLMYQIMGRISEADTPIIFKGALITKLVLAENGYIALERNTKDIDANWIGAPPSMDELVDTINHALGELRSQLHAVHFREYGEKKSAGISIIRNGTEDEVVLMDISMKPVFRSKVYYFGTTGIKGVLANQILADKITVISSKIVLPIPEG